MSNEPGEKPLWVRTWEASRTHGRGMYILLNGVLIYGGTMFVVMTFFASPPQEMTFDIILVSAALWATGGGLFGYFTWGHYEKRYQKYLSEPPESSNSPKK